MVLISTGGMDAETLKSLRRKYFLAPLMLWYMKHCDYEKLKPKLIQASMRHIRNESPEEIAYARDMFETIFRDYPQEKDVHISTLLADLMNQRPVTAEDFRALKGKILLILPDQDFFSGKMREDLTPQACNSSLVIALLLREDAGGPDPADVGAGDPLCLRRAPLHGAEDGGLYPDHPGFPGRRGEGVRALRRRDTGARRKRREWE